ncbi:MAG TPA: GntR family transcriptional regulator, partial [Actinomycetota bacterium]
AGDQLPTVREVVATLAINPNTVQKAYRELERDGVVEGRPGVGTFVTTSVRGPSPAVRASLDRGLQRWLHAAFDAGLDREGVIAVFESNLLELHREGVA